MEIRLDRKTFWLARDPARPAILDEGQMVNETERRQTAAGVPKPGQPDILTARGGGLGSDILRIETHMARAVVSPTRDICIVNFNRSPSSERS